MQFYMNFAHFCIKIHPKFIFGPEFRIPDPQGISQDSISNLLYPDPGRKLLEVTEGGKDDNADIPDTGFLTWIRSLYQGSDDAYM